MVTVVPKLPTPQKQRTWHESDAPYTFPNDDAETQRLDAMHNSVKDYFGGGRTTLAPLDDLYPPPKKILELGNGSGAWWVDMALKFPDAHVIGVDVTPCPRKNVPSNCEFMMLNLANDFPFEAESFDIIHARFLLVHMPHFPKVIDQCIKALRPGGLLLLEDIDHYLHAVEGPQPESIKRFYELYHAHMGKSGIDGQTGAKLEGVLKATGAFSEVHAMKIACPMSYPYTDDAKLNRMGLVMRQSVSSVYDGIETRMAESGITRDIVEDLIKDAHDQNKKICMNFYWTWSRKLGGDI